MINFVRDILVVLCLFTALWFMLSWGEVIANNLGPNPELSSWNMFTEMLGEA